METPDQSENPEVDVSGRQAWKETAEIKEAVIVQRDKRIAVLHDTLAFAAGVIKSGKPWTGECEKKTASHSRARSLCGGNMRS